MDDMRGIITSSLESGEIDIAGNQHMSLSILLYFVGEPLESARGQLLEHLRSLRELKLGFQSRIAAIWAQLLLSLGSLDGDHHYLSGEYFDEESMLPLLEREHRLTQFYTYLPLAIHAFHVGEYKKSLRYCERAMRNSSHLFGFPIQMDHATFHALVMLQRFPEATARQRERYRRALSSIRRSLAACHRRGAQNFSPNHYLVEAETARVFGSLRRAVRYYEKAIETARCDQYLNMEALACELAGRCCVEHGLESICGHYLSRARSLYLRWGMVWKARDLEERYHDLLDERSLYLPETATPTSPATEGKANLDSVVKALRTLSTETGLETLLNRMMGIVMEHAGAEKGALLLKQDGRWLVQATGDFPKKRYAVLLNVPYAPERPARKNVSLASSVVNLCLRSGRTLLIADASSDGRFNSDPYIRRHHVRSILCLPLLYQGRLNGALYLENRLTSEVFGRIRMEKLEMLCTQFSISFENALLYQALDRKLRFEKLVSALSAAFVNIPTDQVDRQLASWLRKVTVFLGVDRGAVYQLSIPANGFILTHSFYRRGVGKPPPSLSGFPWYAGAVADNCMIAIQKPDDLPRREDSAGRPFGAGHRFVHRDPPVGRRSRLRSRRVRHPPRSFQSSCGSGTCWRSRQRNVSGKISFASASSFFSSRSA